MSVNLRINAGIQKTVSIKALNPDSGRKFVTAIPACPGGDRQFVWFCKLGCAGSLGVEVLTIHEQEEE